MTPQILPVVLLLAILVTGCSSGERLSPVSGKVSLNGESITFGSIAFHPDADKGNTRTEQVRGQINSEGVYQLKVGDRPGAPPGWYRVTVHAFKRPSADDKGPPEYLGDPRYQTPEKSGLAIQVLDNPAAGAYDIDIKP